MEQLNIEKTWCEYLKPCPYLNINNDSSGIMVGDYDCSICKYNKKYYKNYIICSYNDKK